MRRLTIFAIALAAVSIDCAVLAGLGLWGWRPSLSLCVLVASSVLYGKMSGALTGLLIGLMLDVLFAPARGFYTLTNFLTGYAAGAAYERGMREDPFLMGILSVGLYLLREGIAALLALLLGVRIGNILYLFVRYLFPSALLTGLVCVPLFALLRYVMTTGYMRRRRVGLD
jgi:rod shape-determining protein MreD